MDKNRFDGFTRQLAQRENRRQAIKTLLAGGAGTAAALMIGKEATQAAKPSPGGGSDCCPADHPKLCSLTCTAVATDPNNCGACGVTCGANQTCVDGACSPPPAQCRKVSDCASSNTECQTATACKRGTCIYTYIANNTPVGNQTLGDCQTRVCDGAGNITFVADSTDTPTPQNECYIGTCTGGTPGQRSKIQGTQCADGNSKCDGNGNCVQCLTESDCPPSTSECQTPVCASGVCGFDNVSPGTLLREQTTGNCRLEVCDGNGGITSQYADDPPAGDGVCLPSYTCDNGTALPQYASTDTTCAKGWCDGFGNCVTCNVNEQCLPGPGTSLPICNADHTCGYTCSPGYVGCPGGIDCGTNITSDINNCGGCGQICNPANATGTCNAGQCVITSCNPGYADCNGNPSDGCEIALNTDNNCGSCGNKCGSGTKCTNGQCIIPFD